MRGYRDALRLVLVEQHEDRDYETLELSSRGWHDGAHDPWPYINVALFILKTAYKEFEERLGQTVALRGEKTEFVTRTIRKARGHFASRASRGPVLASAST